MMVLMAEKGITWEEITKRWRTDSALAGQLPAAGFSKQA